MIAMATELKACPDVQYEFIVSDSRSSSNQKRIRRQIHRDTKRRRGIRSAKALELAEPLLWVSHRPSPVAGFDNAQRDLLVNSFS
jgi:hypothetical protein